jgi:ferrochelatase
MTTLNHIIVANFGGPRDLEEVLPFLTTLLNDHEVIRPFLPLPLHRLLFTWIARRRTPRVQHDYQTMGGRSPIFDDTEWVGGEIHRQLGVKTSVFHRYLPATHDTFFAEAAELPRGTTVFPLFPQFSYATTGSIKEIFRKRLLSAVFEGLNWVDSYPDHPAYIGAMQGGIRDFLEAQHLSIDEVALLFSAHGLPVSFVRRGDPYPRECTASYKAIRAAFPTAVTRLSYQSKFGYGKWLGPPTGEMCHNVLSWSGGRRHVVIVPLSFTSDHIETLFEIERLYLPPIRAAGLQAYRCPALNRRPDWVAAIREVLVSPRSCSPYLAQRGRIQ